MIATTSSDGVRKGRSRSRPVFQSGKRTGNQIFRTDFKSAIAASPATPNPEFVGNDWQGLLI
jgi:hypothetical protein